MTALQLTRHAAQQPCQRINYSGTAQVWREAAHKAQVAGDFEAMRQAHFRALENEACAREQDRQEMTLRGGAVVARLAHNQEDAGSSPVPATIGGPLFRQWAFPVGALRVKVFTPG